ncbi:hypothetical protein [Chromobacterium haemolyticum]|uniref:hypothetical protein n=1 Tax=Chromobacterium haemolyticum TaxID=394935 RepID=UPI001315FA5E|nr:hypothetical protein [Chromobacterium haemolyticum]BBH12924.1 hypothetical protein CH06BL_21720 [Chromobacterium haemolyticum]
MHWSDPYVGMEYAADGLNCAALAERVAGEVLGLAVILPDKHQRTPFGRNAQIAACKEKFAQQVTAPVDGHPVLLLARGRLQHIGVMCWITGEWWVLHADEGFGEVVLQRLRSLSGYEVEGFYQWK